MMPAELQALGVSDTDFHDTIHGINAIFDDAERMTLGQCCEEACGFASLFLLFAFITRRYDRVCGGDDVVIGRK